MQIIKRVFPMILRRLIIVDVIAIRIGLFWESIKTIFFAIHVSDSIGQLQDVFK